MLLEARASSGTRVVAERALPEIVGRAIRHLKQQERNGHLDMDNVGELNAAIGPAIDHIFTDNNFVNAVQSYNFE